VEPPSGTLDLAPDQDIEITFNELVDPVSVPGSVVLTPELTFTTRVRGRRITIRPEEPFQTGRIYILTLQRGIRDYQKNSIPRSYQLVFSTGGEIPTGHIRGQVAEFDAKTFVEVGLFQRSDTLAGFYLVQSVNLGDDGTFSCAYLPDGIYRLVAAEGGLGDFPAAINRRPYALPTVDSLVIQGDTATVLMRRSAPLARPQMRSVEWVAPNYLTITFNTPFGEALLPPNLYPTDDPTTYGHVLATTGEDTTVIDLGEGYTQLGEPYRLEPLAVPTPELVDTLPPVLTVPGGRVPLAPAAGDGEWTPRGGAAPGRTPFGEFRGRITFSEPVNLSPGLMARLTGKDTLDVPLQQVTPLAAVMDITEPERFDQAAILGWEITDEAGNAMTDSLLRLTLVFTPSQATGSVRGVIVGLPGTPRGGYAQGQGLSGRVVVEARDAETGQRVAFTVTDSASYFLANVPPGFYQLFGHEQVGAYPVPYYSGRWEPYHQAARFAYYPEVVEVRPRWEVDGIDIKFTDGVLISTPDDSAMKRE